MKAKVSFYNELIRIDETEEYLLYNVITGGLQILDSERGAMLASLSQVECFQITKSQPEYEFLMDLYNDGFVVGSDINEQELYRLDYQRKQLAKFRNNSYIGLTIGTTILCNMGCPYCFQTVKPNKSLRDPRVIEGIVTFIDDMITKAPVKKWSGLSIMWYGGEPLVNKDVVSVLSEKFWALSKRYDIPYEASIVTNGTLLDRDNWHFLIKNRISTVQITIDGSKEVHDLYRPLKQLNSKNYERILENLSVMPLGISTTIRVNTDRTVANSIPQLLNDLSEFGIWPQRHKQISIKLAWLRAYDGANTQAMDFLTQKEFFEVENELSETLAGRFNKWAEINGSEKAKVKWKMPETQNDCATYVSPYFFTFDPDGNIHKCWETIHDTSKSTQVNVLEVLKGYDVNDFEKYLSYSRTNVHPVCQECKFNPVCEGISCSYDTLSSLSKGEFPCTAWKTELRPYFKKMYLKMKKEPNNVVVGPTSSATHQTHANR